MSFWSNKVALVTGGSSGLGRAIAESFLEAGAKVAIAARGVDKLEATAAELRHQVDAASCRIPKRQDAASTAGDVLPIAADVMQQADVDRMVQGTVDRFGRLDVLVNNAGRSARGEILATTPEEFEELMRLNLIALVRTTRAAAPHLLRAQGHLVNIGSLASKIATRYMGAYPATKFAVAAYTQQLRLELAPQGLHVLLVCPGPIARDEPREYAAAGNIPEGARKSGAGAKVRALKPEDVAAAILTACERRRGEIVLPGRARMLSALCQLSPALGDWLIRKMT